MSTIHPIVDQVTRRIRERSADSRTAYLEQVDAMAARPPGAQSMGCANVAHAFAGIPGRDRIRIVEEKAPNVAIVTAYNDVLSAHAPLAHYPDILKDEARRLGATAQVAGGVPAMCDGVTQGAPGMELSLFSRDAIAMGTAIALSHDVFDAALMLGICDKIVPGLLIGALHFGHLPTVFVPAGPMTSGLSNSDKAKVREQAAQGLVGRKELLAAETAAYHGEGTCTFYGTANSNQMLLEAMGLHVPGTAFINPADGERELLTREAMRTVLDITKSRRFAPIGHVVDERCIVNAMVALLATGGSTNHLIHWVAVARAAGIRIDWNDFSELSGVVPLLARVYPNGSADVNQFQFAGGPGYVIGQLLKAGLMHGDVLTVREQGLQEFACIPAVQAGQLAWHEVGTSGDLSVLRPADQPFSATGGLKLLSGNLGRSVIKVSAVPEDRHIIEAPARVFDSQEALQQAFKAGELDRDVVCVVRWQGPRANGMPELHKLTPPLAVLQGKGYKVALVTDGRMSGASGKVPAAIHVSPEACVGGPLARLRDGDSVRLDAVAGTLAVLVSEDEWLQRPVATMPQALRHANGRGFGRELFAGFRRHALSAEEGACTWINND
ncbi:phosphogluconate dehydratase [Comamonas aquatica]|uniref:phosphogluconate dehydratase n=1 Tax=Comamonas aquatica TaxID=225991 RepID=UPI0005ECA9ED|nr:phosphogluconate dehydratase [Comamonas aquatica]ANY62691.1 phosphogluconate dehydratase [Comamonas aquatica]MDH0372911.1 phosphogluconate dehydratase [Comamonas aquatica]MDH0382854.1 phosphogluconate dehydratase [Comamonas aquatica]MDH0430793.1 phosphogluconate dehydratase [Comamonas aquatica]MDH0494939.1 phosphogluconate dehydratase [Comamonas aquatica]